MSSLGKVLDFKNFRRRPIGSTRRRSLSKLSDDVGVGVVVLGNIGVGVGVLSTVNVPVVAAFCCSFYCC